MPMFTKSEKNVTSQFEWGTRSAVVSIDSLQYKILLVESIKIKINFKNAIFFQFSIMKFNLHP